MSQNAMSLKARIRNLSKQKNVAAQVLLQNYMFERFLERLSRSEYKDKFVMKGGMLIAAIVGLDTRSTMDLDTTLRSLPLTEASIYLAANEICSMPIDDGVTFLVGTVAPIRSDDDYGGFRVMLTARYDTIETPLSIDVSTGDVMTPDAVRYAFTGIFDETLKIELWAYNIETVLAEKIETILRRNVFTTRPRDFYDVYILGTTQEFDAAVLQDAIAATARHRGTTDQIADRERLISVIADSRELQRMWEKYQRQFSYASDISYSEGIAVLRRLCNVD